MTWWGTENLDHEGKLSPQVFSVVVYIHTSTINRTETQPFLSAVAVQSCSKVYSQALPSLFLFFQTTLRVCNNESIKVSDLRNSDWLQHKSV